MLGSAVQVRPLLPSTKKAAYRAAFFVRPSSGIRSCGSGPSPRKGGFEPPGRIPEASFSSVRCSVSETRCNGGAFRDRSSHPWPLLVWPSLAKQLPPGTTIAPLTWQRNRHGSQKPPGPFYEARFVGAGPARERERSSRQDPRDFSLQRARTGIGCAHPGHAASTSL